MINFLSSIFDSISSFFQQVFDLIAHFIEDIVTFFGYLKIIPSLVSKFTDFVPLPYIIFITITVTVSIIYLIVGRSTGGD